MKNNTGYRILADGCAMSNDTHRTKLNNNDVIIGPSGAGKTRSYVLPNILQGNESMVITDTKGSILSEVRGPLERAGYEIMQIDLCRMTGDVGYNPLDYIGRDSPEGMCDELDITTVANCILPLENRKDPFWEQAACNLIASLIGYTMDCLPEQEHHLGSVSQLLQHAGSGVVAQLMEELGAEAPDHFAYQRYSMFMTGERAEKMQASICGIAANSLNTLTGRRALRLYTAEKRVRFSELAQKKTALILTVSDSDRAFDKLVTLFYTQALQALIRYADSLPEHRLPVPVRFIFDDFATYARIPDFDSVIATIRSREIYASLILQDLLQLEDRYGHAKAMTILNCCDNLLFLGGQDVTTAEFIAKRANLTVSTVLRMPLDEAFLFTRGQPPRRVRKFDLCSHPAYQSEAEPS